MTRMNDKSPHIFSVTASGPFDLANQNRYFGSWPLLPGDPGAIVMAFPVEGSEASAAVVLRQSGGGVIAGEVHACPPALADRAMQQALAAVSLDLDGSGWPAVGARDPAIGRLQTEYRHLRPTLFHSPYEAAAAFVIGHRISIKQTRALRARIAAAHGTPIELDGERFFAFPTPDQLLAAGPLPGINPIKTERLRAIAQAAKDGWLTREHLRAMREDEALNRLKALPGIGAFFAQGILYRGAGCADALTDDQITTIAVTRACGLTTPADQDAVEAIAERWRPYRMWTVVLLHVWARRELAVPARQDARRVRQRIALKRQ
jgi:DNA-3-methyladenine glycosylase II